MMQLVMLSQPSRISKVVTNTIWMAISVDVQHEDALVKVASIASLE